MAKFQAGQSGNPGGRPADGTLREAARAQTEVAVKTLVEIMGNRKAPASSRVSAACALLDRGYGRPVQSTELTGKDGEALMLAPPTTQEDMIGLARKVAFMLRKGVEAQEDAHRASGASAGPTTQASTGVHGTGATH